MKKGNVMFNTLRSLTLLAAIVASLVAGASTADAGTLTKPTTTPHVSPAVISWE